MAQKLGEFIQVARSYRLLDLVRDLQLVRLEYALAVAACLESYFVQLGFFVHHADRLKYLTHVVALKIPGRECAICIDDSKALLILQENLAIGLALCNSLLEHLGRYKVADVSTTKR